MAFVPLLKLTEIPRSSDYFKLQDITPTYTAPSTNPTGYGCAGGPANFAAVNDVRVLVQYTGEDPVEVPSSVQSGGLASALKLDFHLMDGVQKITGLYGMDCDPLVYTWAIVGGSDNLKVQCTLVGISLTLPEALENVTHIKFGSNPTLFKIKSVDTTTGILELYEPITALSLVNIGKFYSSTVRALIVNEGESKLIKDIANMALADCSCDKETSVAFIERVLLKLAAQTAFSCGNFVKAHNAAILLNQSGSTTICTTC